MSSLDLGDTLAEIRDRVACVASDLEAIAAYLDASDINPQRMAWVAGELRRKAQELGGTP